MLDSLTHKLLPFHSIITYIYENHIKFEVSLHFWRIWPSVRRAANCSGGGAAHSKISCRSNSGCQMARHEFDSSYRQVLTCLVMHTSLNISLNNRLKYSLIHAWLEVSWLAAKALVPCSMGWNNLWRSISFKGHIFWEGTPLRIPRISGLKSQILKPPFLS